MTREVLQFISEGIQGTSHTNVIVVTKLLAPQVTLIYRIKFFYIFSDKYLNIYHVPILILNAMI